MLYSEHSKTILRENKSIKALEGLGGK